MKSGLTRHVRASARQVKSIALTASTPLSARAEFPDPLEVAEESRRKQIEAVDRERRSTLGQFFTPPETARLMASMSSLLRERIRVLDAGAGAGVLTAALVTDICSRSVRPKELFLTAYEIDDTLVSQLRRTLAACEQVCAVAGISCNWEIRGTDFIESAVNLLDEGLFETEHPSFDVAIVNPPYKKFRSESRVRQLLRRLNIETSNLYAAFLALVVLLLDKGGELIAITPRSFCNGPYFRPYREHLLRNLNLTRIHVFESRGRTFREDNVLQENMILRAMKGIPQQRLVCITESHSPCDPIANSRDVPFESVVRPGDPGLFIHLVPRDEGHTLAEAMQKLPCTLEALGLTVSTGRVVDFRARQWLQAEPNSETVPLIYPANFDNGLVRWPSNNHKKPTAILYTADSSSLMVPAGIYVLVKRFSAKEERRRIVAAIFDRKFVPCESVGFENHVNYFHKQGAPLDLAFARGLSLFLNCTPLDNYFRQFNGHTQVNATDLRSLRYPTRDALTVMGRRIEEVLPAQEVIDAIVTEIIGVQ